MLLVQAEANSLQEKTNALLKEIRDQAITEQSPRWGGQTEAQRRAQIARRARAAGEMEAAIQQALLGLEDDPSDVDCRVQLIESLIELKAPQERLLQELEMGIKYGPKYKYREIAIRLSAIRVVATLDIEKHGEPLVQASGHIVLGQIDLAFECIVQQIQKLQDGLSRTLQSVQRDMIEKASLSPRIESQLFEVVASKSIGELRRQIETDSKLSVLSRRLAPHFDRGEEIRREAQRWTQFYYEKSKIIKVLEAHRRLHSEVDGLLSKKENMLNEHARRKTDGFIAMSIAGLIGLLCASCLAGAIGDKIAGERGGHVALAICIVVYLLAIAFYNLFANSISRSRLTWEMERSDLVARLREAIEDARSIAQTATPLPAEMRNEVQQIPGQGERVLATLQEERFELSEGVGRWVGLALLAAVLFGLYALLVTA